MFPSNLSFKLQALFTFVLALLLFLYEVVVQPLTFRSMAILHSLKLCLKSLILRSVKALRIPKLVVKLLQLHSITVLLLHGLCGMKGLRLPKLVIKLLKLLCILDVPIMELRVKLLKHQIKTLIPLSQLPLCLLALLCFG